MATSAIALSPSRISSGLTFLLRAECLVFLAANLCDILLTWHLLCHSEIEFVETNPLARYFLYGWGIKGLITFKLLGVGVAISACQIIALQRVQVARRVLQFGAAVVCTVVGYSLMLLYNADQWV